MSELWLAIVLDEEGRISSELTNDVLMSHPSLFDDSSQFELGGFKYRTANISKILDTKGHRHFDITFEFGSFLFVRMPQYSISSIQIRGCVAGNADASNWLKYILKRKDFVHAYLYDEEYDLLQNATNPAAYRMRNKPLDQAVLYWDKSLNCEFIDISKNPGRRAVRKGYIESIGHIMWFSPKFWQRVGCTIDDIRSIPEIESINRDGDIDVIHVQDTPFISSRGMEGRIQEQIRTTLFEYGAN